MKKKRRRKMKFKLKMNRRRMQRIEGGRITVPISSCSSFSSSCSCDDYDDIGKKASIE